MRITHFLKATCTPLGLFVIGLCAVAICSSCVSPNRTVTTKTGLSYQIIAAGSGPVARSGQTVRIHETTALADGTVIYSTRTRNNPVKFLLGGNQAIAGVDEGVRGMRVGERRKLVVPPSLSRRSSYPANLSPDAILHYDIELVEIIQE